MKWPSLYQPVSLGTYILIGALLFVGAVLATVVVWYTVQTMALPTPGTASPESAVPATAADVLP
jgi:hypothetical protein